MYMYFHIVQQNRRFTTLNCITIFNWEKQKLILIFISFISIFYFLVIVDRQLVSPFAYPNIWVFKEVIERQRTQN
jgi:hypothetical protein